MRGGYHLRSIGQIPPHNKRDLLLGQLFDGNLQRIRLSLEVYKHWRIETDNMSVRGIDS